MDTSGILQLRNRSIIRSPPVAIPRVTNPTVAAVPFANLTDDAGPLGNPTIDIATNATAEADLLANTTVNTEADDHANLTDDTKVNPPANLTDDTKVNPPANLTDDTEVNPLANLTDDAIVNPLANITDDAAIVGPLANLTDDTEVNSPANLTDDTEVNPLANLTDDAIVNPLANTNVNADSLANPTNDAEAEPLANPAVDADAAPLANSTVDTALLSIPIVADTAPVAENSCGEPKGRRSRRSSGKSGPRRDSGKRTGDDGGSGCCGWCLMSLLALLLLLLACLGFCWFSGNTDTFCTAIFNRTSGQSGSIVSPPGTQICKRPGLVVSAFRLTLFNENSISESQSKDWSYRGAEVATIKLLGPSMIHGFTLDYSNETSGCSSSFSSFLGCLSIFGQSNKPCMLKEFKIEGLSKESRHGFGEFEYEPEGRTQYFQVQNVSNKAFPHIELQIISNHCNSDLRHTCICGFRVHGKLDHAEDL